MQAACINKEMGCTLFSIKARRYLLAAKGFAIAKDGINQKKMLNKRTNCNVLFVTADGFYCSYLKTVITQTNHNLGTLKHIHSKILKQHTF